MQNLSIEMFPLYIVLYQARKPDKLYNHQAFTAYSTDTVYAITTAEGKHCQQDYSRFYNVVAANNIATNKNVALPDTLNESRARHAVMLSPSAT